MREPIETAAARFVARIRPLAGMGAGARAAIALIPIEQDLAAEFAALGLLPGEEIEVVQTTPFRGPMLIRAGGGVYAVGWTLATRVLVTERP